MDDYTPISGIIIIVMLVIINAFLVAAKTAFLTVNESSVKKKAEFGDKRYIHLVKLLETPDKYIYVFELLLSFLGVFFGISYTIYFFNGIDSFIQNYFRVDRIFFIQPLLYVLLTVCLVFVVSLCGTILPKKLATKHAENLACQIVYLIRILLFLCKPINFILEKVTGLILFIFGIKPSELMENVTEEEIISMVNEGQEQGVFDAGEAEMIANIIEMDEKETQDIMTPKKKVVAVNTEMSIEDALSFMLSENYSRYPLYEDNRDNIIGILHLKDVFRAYIGTERKVTSLRDIAREAYFVPDTQNINILFQEMQSKNIHMAIAIDEYGQTAGLVAMEDILEEIVGNIQDEYDEEESMILDRQEDYCIVKGSIRLKELEAELNIPLDNNDFDTLNGLLISLLDRIPSDGETAIIEYGGCLYHILETKNKMIDQVKILKLNKEENNDMINIV